MECRFLWCITVYISDALDTLVLAEAGVFSECLNVDSAAFDVIYMLHVVYFHFCICQLSAFYVSECRLQKDDVKLFIFVPNLFVCFCE